MIKTLRATYDGKVFLPDEPIDLQPQTPVVVLIETTTDQIIAIQNSAKNTWDNNFFQQTYGMFKDEPLVREPQSPYEMRDEIK